VKCSSCGAEIDAKAIVCYRCGTPTADPATLKPRPQPKSSGITLWWVVLVALLVAAGLFLYWRSLS